MGSHQVRTRFVFNDKKGVFFGQYNVGDCVGDGMISYPNGEEFSGVLSFDTVGEQNTQFNYYSGEWQRGCWDGKGEIVYHNGVVFKGRFSQGVKHGSGVSTSIDGVMVYEEWEHGKLVESRTTVHCS